MKLLAFIVLFATAQSSLSCEPILYDPQAPKADPPRRVSGDQCSAEFRSGSWTPAKISSAEDIGGGFVLQTLIEDQGCGFEIDHVVQDCNSGRVAVFGGDYGSSLSDGEQIRSDGTIASPDIATEDLLAKVRDFARAGRNLSVDEILVSAEQAGVKFRFEANTKSTLAINDYKFRLGCGCKLYYGG